MRSGVYAIRNKISHRMYIGSAVDIKNRWSVHLCVLIAGTHHSFRLQKSWDKFGENTFEWIVLELCDKPQLLEREQYYLDLHQTYLKQYGYNILRTAGSNFGKKASTATKRKLSEAAKKRNADPVYNKMISDRCKAQWQDPEFRAVALASRPTINPNKGKPMPEAQKQLLRELALARREQMVEAARKSVLARGMKLKNK